MHTPIVWQKNIGDRAARLLQTLPGGFTAPVPPVLSLVTGDVSYSDYNSRDILHRWADEPQLLWDGVYQTLALGIENVIHVGPDPNIIPATYTRLADNVAAQLKASVGLRAMSGMVNRPWLRALLPARSALLRAPSVKQVILEDWLLEQEV
jgi:[acyl-carrier-protein] S-malonyltransferase